MSKELNELINGHNQMLATCFELFALNPDRHEPIIDRAIESSFELQDLINKGLLR